MHKRNAVVTAGVRLFHALTTSEEEHAKRASEHEAKPDEYLHMDLCEMVVALMCVCEHMHEKHYDLKGKFYIPMQVLRRPIFQRTFKHALKHMPPPTTPGELYPLEVDDIIKRLTDKQARAEWQAEIDTVQAPYRARRARERAAAREVARGLLNY
jgi:hypothetical protein